MADTAAELRLPANYTGSGGAIVVLAEDRPAARELGSRLRDEGCRLVEPEIAEGLADRSES
jgi:hypothetical protein